MQGRRGAAICYNWQGRGQRLDLVAIEIKPSPSAFYYSRSWLTKHHGGATGTHDYLNHGRTNVLGSTFVDLLMCRSWNFEYYIIFVMVFFNSSKPVEN